VEINDGTKKVEFCVLAEFLPRPSMLPRVLWCSWSNARVEIAPFEPDHVNACEGKASCFDIFAAGTLAHLARVERPPFEPDHGNACEGRHIVLFFATGTLATLLGLRHYRSNLITVMRAKGGYIFDRFW